LQDKIITANVTAFVAGQWETIVIIHTISGDWKDPALKLQNNAIG